MDVWHIEAKCESGHVQFMELARDLYTRDGAEFFCGIVDGTSSAYLYPPGESSIIGKCGICRKPFRAHVTDPQGSDAKGE